MNTRRILALSALALLGTVGTAAYADGEGDNLSPYALQFQSSRPADEVHAEAVEAAQHHDLTAAASVVAAPVKSPATRADVRRDAIQAAQAGRIERGEFTPS
ncbi:DUF4148 domain-containing protein [uncultured Xylophilus sp.]|uniref:DUF4148 domain-containing protein n=1 Tax=uncultured Xylophilus sp. TaxID=296832 RepID=UPI0025D258BC|nr:DUF4148 domain-containing protein [uncultured Xylophilus sp.]